MIGMVVLGLLTRLGLAGASGPDPEVFARFLDAWHDFYLLAGTAAVTLAGLLFVSLSFNMEHLLHVTRAHLLQFARNTMLVYISVLMLSLMMLVPHVPMRLLGVQLLVVGLLLALLSLLASWRLVRERESVFSVRHRLRRGLPPVLGGGILAYAGIGFVEGQTEASYVIISAVCLLLASAVWSSWDLLVGVARARRGDPAQRG